MIRRLLIAFCFLALASFGSLQAQASGGSSQSGSQPGASSSSQSGTSDQSGSQSGASSSSQSGTSDQYGSQSGQSGGTSSSSQSGNSSAAGQSGNNLPRTASNLPLIGLMGFLLLAASLGLRSVRALSKNR